MKPAFCFVISTFLFSLSTTHAVASDVYSSGEMIGTFKEVSLPFVKLTETSDPGVWATCAERARIHNRSGMDKLAKLDPKPGNKVVLKNFRMTDGRCYFDELEVLSRDSAKKPERKKMKLKPHIAEGYIYGFNPLHKGEIRLSPRVTFAADDNGKPLKCSLFRPENLTITAQQNYQKEMNRQAEDFANWYDYGRQRVMVRLTEVKKDYRKRCSFAQVLPLDEEGKVNASPFKYHFEYTPDFDGSRDHQYCLKNSVKFNMFPLKEKPEVTLLDYCRCVGVHAVESNPSQSYGTCMDPKLYN
jgi:hypothetical protein